MSNLKTRTLTGVFIVVFILGGIILHPLTFVATVLAIMVLTQTEYLKLVTRTGSAPQLITSVASGIFIYALSSLAAAGLIGLEWLLTALLPGAVIIAVELYRKGEKPFDSIAHSVFSVIYIAVPFSLFPFSAFAHEGIPTLTGGAFADFSPAMVIGFFLLLWVNDTGAYLVGISVGKHRLFERISPKKSWEGFFGGALLSMAAGWFIAPYLGVTDSTGWLIAALIVTVAGTFGDLAESMLKRSAGVKDSGDLLPGHGGFLDRFDSTLISFPLVYLWFTLFC